MRKFFIYFLVFSRFAMAVLPGVDVFFEEKRYLQWKNKRVGLITNHTGVNANLQWSVELFYQHQGPHYQLVALFSPEHGLQGQSYAGEAVGHKKWENIPVYSLHGKNRRITEEMLKGIDVLVYDMQCTGVRAYTYPTTLFYVMEEAAKKGIEVIVLDRPNPINGQIVDGPMLDEKWRSFIGYINVPYCHGMTIGELAF